MKASARANRGGGAAGAEAAKAPPKLRVGFVLAQRFTLTAFAGFVDALRLLPMRVIAAGRSNATSPA